MGDLEKTISGYWENSRSILCHSIADLKRDLKKEEALLHSSIVKRIANLEAERDLWKLTAERNAAALTGVQTKIDMARAEALREVKLWCQHQRTGCRSEATDLMTEILSMLNGLIAGAEQPAPAESEPETGEDNENGQFGVGA